MGCAGVTSSRSAARNSLRTSGPSVRCVSCRSGTSHTHHHACSPASPEKCCSLHTSTRNTDLLTHLQKEKRILRPPTHTLSRQCFGISVIPSYCRAAVVPASPAVAAAIPPPPTRRRPPPSRGRRAEQRSAARPSGGELPRGGEVSTAAFGPGRASTVLV